MRNKKEMCSLPWLQAHTEGTSPEKGPNHLGKLGDEVVGGGVGGDGRELGARSQPQGAEWFRTQGEGGSEVRRDDDSGRWGGSASYSSGSEGVCRDESKKQMQGVDDCIKPDRE